MFEHHYYHLYKECLKQGTHQNSRVPFFLLLLFLTKNNKKSKKKNTKTCKHLPAHNYKLFLFTSVTNTSRMCGQVVLRYRAYDRMVYPVQVPPLQ